MDILKACPKGPTIQNGSLKILGVKPGVTLFFKSHHGKHCVHEMKQRVKCEAMRSWDSQLLAWGVAIDFHARQKILNKLNHDTVAIKDIIDLIIDPQSL